MWRIVAVTIIVACGHEGDECGIYFENTALTCNDLGMCQHTDVSCDFAAQHISRLYGALPLPELSDGFLHQPSFVSTVRWPRTAIARAMTHYNPVPAISERIRKLRECVERITGELDSWAPRIIFVPSRIGGTLRDAYLILWDLWVLATHHDAILFVAGILTESLYIREFCTRMSMSIEAALSMGDLRTSGYLRSAVPFLHLFAELTALFPLHSVIMGGFLEKDVGLMLTISQFHPM